jgi:uncharacterized protein
VLELVERGLLTVTYPLAKDASAVRALMARYSNVPMDLADACLVRLSEIHRECLLLTVDSDFRIYRRNGRDLIPALMPDPG